MLLAPMDADEVPLIAASTNLLSASSIYAFTYGTHLSIYYRCLTSYAESIARDR